MKIQPHAPGGRVLPGGSGRTSTRTRLFVAGPLALCVAALSFAPGAWAQGAPLSGNSAGPGAPGPPPFASASGILLDGRTGKVLWGKDEGRVRAPASLTKILTALVVLENADLASRVTITPEARAAAGSRTYAESGWSFSVEDLLYGLLLPSGNDAAIALAQKVSPDGTQEGFMRMVNRRAAEMGAASTRFMNPHGLDEPGHTTTARDMGLITLTALRNPTFASMVKARSHRVRWGDGTARSFRNHNKLLSRYPGTVGVKTGYTGSARHTLASAVHRNGTTLVAVTMGSFRQYDDSVVLFDWGFANLAALRASARDEIWPPRPAAPNPGAGKAGSDLIADTLGLLRSVGGAPGGSALAIPVLALSTFFAASLAAGGLVVLRTQRRIRRGLLLVSIPNVQVSPAAEIPHVNR